MRSTSPITSPSRSCPTRRCPAAGADRDSPSRSCRCSARNRTPLCGVRRERSAHGVAARGDRVVVERERGGSRSEVGRDVQIHEDVAAVHQPRGHHAGPVRLPRNHREADPRAGRHQRPGRRGRQAPWALIGPRHREAIATRRRSPRRTLVAPRGLCAGHRRAAHRGGREVQTVGHAPGAPRAAHQVG